MRSSLVHRCPASKDLADSSAVSSLTLGKSSLNQLLSSDLAWWKGVIFGVLVYL